MKTRIGSEKQKERVWEPESEVKKTEERDVGTRIGSEQQKNGMWDP